MGWSCAVEVWSGLRRSISHLLNAALGPSERQLCAGDILASDFESLPYLLEVIACVAQEPLGFGNRP
jgi:hypothetical protein